MKHILFLLYRLGFRFDKILYEDYRVPLVCRKGYHDPYPRGYQAKCGRCGMGLNLRILE